MQQLLDTTLTRASDEVKARFAQLTEPATTAAQTRHAPDAERRLIADPTISTILEWLDTHTGWAPGAGRRKVAAELADLNVLDLHDRAALRGRVNQHQLADALRDYYAVGVDGYGLYGARYGDNHAVTSVLTCPQWLDLE